MKLTEEEKKRELIDKIWLMRGHAKYTGVIDPNATSSLPMEQPAKVVHGYYGEDEIKDYPLHPNLWPVLPFKLPRSDEVKKFNQSRAKAKNMKKSKDGGGNELICSFKKRHAPIAKEYLLREYLSKFGQIERVQFERFVYQHGAKPIARVTFVESLPLSIFIQNEHKLSNGITIKVYPSTSHLEKTLYT